MAELTNQRQNKTNSPNTNKSFLNDLTPYQNNKFLRKDYLLKRKIYSW